MDKKSSEELIDYILLSIDLIEERFSCIETGDDFLDTRTGLEKLDAISMRLQSIGEAIKNILKREPEVLLREKSSNYWSDIVKFREVISHHYIDIDAEIVFEICKDELPELKSAIKNINPKQPG